MKLHRNVFCPRVYIYFCSVLLLCLAPYVTRMWRQQAYIRNKSLEKPGKLSKLSNVFSWGVNDSTVHFLSFQYLLAGGQCCHVNIKFYKRFLKSKQNTSLCFLVHYCHCLYTNLNFPLQNYKHKQIQSPKRLFFPYNIISFNILMVCMDVSAGITPPGFSADVLCSRPLEIPPDNACSVI